MNTLLFPIVRQCCIYLWTLSLSFARSNIFFRSRITVILTSDSFGCIYESVTMSRCSRWWPISTSGFVLHLENVQIPLFILLPIVVLPFQPLPFKNIISVLFISLLHMHAMLTVAKPVAWTLDPNRPRKTCTSAWKTSGWLTIAQYCAMHIVHLTVKQESSAVADKPARRLRKVCTVYVVAVGL